MVSSEQIKRMFFDLKGGGNRKKRCGCIETKVITFGSSIWIQDTDLMCKKHWQEHVKEFSKQNAARIKRDIADSPRKNKHKRSRKKDDSVETDS